MRNGKTPAKRPTKDPRRVAPKAKLAQGQETITLATIDEISRQPQPAGTRLIQGLLQACSQDTAPS
jgi:hypothetical protein